MTATRGREAPAFGRRTLVASQVVALYVLPNLLLATGAVPAAYRFWVFGVGMTVLRNNNVILVPIRTGLGARLGINVGYLKMTREATWNPF